MTMIAWSNRSAWRLLLAAVLFASLAQAEEPALDAGGLGRAPYGRMYMLLEKTFLNIDVLTLEIRFGANTAEALRALAEGKKPSAELTDRIATRAYRAEDAYVELTFKHSITMNQFVSGARESLERARRANMIDEETYRSSAEKLPRGFVFLADSGIEPGDRLLYRAGPTSLRTVYVDKRGKIRLDRTEAGPGPRLALFGGYFAPGSDLRDGLIASLFHH